MNQADEFGERQIIPVRNEARARSAAVWRRPNIPRYQEEMSAYHPRAKTAPRTYLFPRMRSSARRRSAAQAAVRTTQANSGLWFSLSPWNEFWSIAKER